MPGPDPHALWIDYDCNRPRVLFQAYLWTGNSGNRKSRALAAAASRRLVLLPVRRPTARLPALECAVLPRSLPQAGGTSAKAPSVHRIAAVVNRGVLRHCELLDVFAGGMVAWVCEPEHEDDFFPFSESVQHLKPRTALSHWAAPDLIEEVASRFAHVLRAGGGC